MASNFERVSDRIAEIIEESNDISITPETIKVVRPTSIRKGIMSEGRVLLFPYRNPATRDKLKYFHMFPGIYTLSVEPKTITGVNLFYLPQRFRKFFLGRVQDRITSDGRSLFRYELLKEKKYLRAIMSPAIKQYRINRMGPTALQINPELWGELFTGDAADILDRTWMKAGKNRVYLYSFRKIISAFLDTYDDEEE